MKKIKLSLNKQLIIILSLSFIIMIISLIIVLPKSLEPYFEDTVYSYLEKPLEIFEINQNRNLNSKNIAYIQIEETEVYASSNYKEVLKISDYRKILKYINITERHHERGKFAYNGNIYYYIVNGNEYRRTIAITSDSYIVELRNNLHMIAIPIVVITFSLILILILIWSNNLLRRIGKLKLKVNNMNKPEFSVTKNKIEFDDEILLLDKTVDDMKDLITSNEKYRREMYQNISHDFKTPITVVKSYVEAYHDGIKNADDVINISNEQMINLEKKVQTLLEFNKITYLQNSYKNDKTTDILPLINDAVEKYKIINNKISYEIIKEKKKYIYNGTNDMWESIINNLLSNAIRYAKEKIVITIKEDKLIIFDDGEGIDKNLLKDIFLPYKKGKKGENGLGLSIVKGNLDLLKYNIDVKNKKNGVEFIIFK